MLPLLYENFLGESSSWKLVWEWSSICETQALQFHFEVFLIWSSTLHTHFLWCRGRTLLFQGRLFLTRWFLKEWCLPLLLGNACFLMYHHPKLCFPRWELWERFITNSSDLSMYLSFALFARCKSMPLLEFLFPFLNLELHILHRDIFHLLLA